MFRLVTWKFCLHFCAFSHKQPMWCVVWAVRAGVLFRDNHLRSVRFGRDCSLFFFSVGNISVGYGNLISDFPFRSVDIILMYLRRCGRLHNDKLLWWQYFYFVPCFVLRVKFSVNQLTWQRAVVQQWPWRSSTGQSSLRFYAQAKLPFELTRKLPCSERSETETTHEISFQFSHFYSYSNKNHLG